MTTSNVEALRTIPLFRGMSDRSIHIVSEIAHDATFQPGSELVKEGDPGDSFMIIRRGRASVDQGGRQLRELGEGDFLGEISLIDGGPRTASVTAVEPVEALVIDRAGFARLMDDVPVLRFDVVSALTQRLRDRGAEPLD